MGELFSPDGAPRAGPFVPAAAVPSPLVTPGRRAVINLESGVTWERLTPAADTSVEFLRIVYDVGSESCPEDSLIRHGGKEYGYMIAGRLGVQIGFERYELGPGDSISFDSSSPHRLWTIGNRPAEAIWVLAGRQGDGRVPQPSPGGS
jgi:mannose-6-phosphate isomerase-like protein (cupin superfamily)